MGYAITYSGSNELYHHGILGMHWGERRYQNPDGSLTPLGREHYGYGPERKGRGVEKPTVAVRKVKTDEERAAARAKRIKIAKRVAIGVGAAGLTAALGYGLYSGAAGRLMKGGANAAIRLVNSTGLGKTPVGKAIRRASVAFAKAGVDVNKFGLGVFKPMVDAAAGAVASGASNAAGAVNKFVTEDVPTAARNAGKFVSDRAGEAAGAVNKFVTEDAPTAARNAGKFVSDRAGEAAGAVNKFVTEDAPTAARNAGKYVSKKAGDIADFAYENVGKPVAQFGNNVFTFITSENGAVVPVLRNIKTGAIEFAGDLKENMSNIQVSENTARAMRTAGAVAGGLAAGAAADAAIDRRRRKKER